MINSRTYIETCNLEIAEKLKDISIQDYLDLIGTDKTEEYKKDAESWIRIMKEFSKQQIKKKKILTTYKYAKKCNEGRLYAENHSLQLIKREFRGILSNGIYYDFDMINCHPVILNYLCKIKNVRTDYLDDYCRSRNEKILDLCSDDEITKEQAKLLFIKAINSEYKCEKTENNHKIKNKFFIKFDGEIKKIMEQLTHHYKEEFLIIKETENDNVKGKFMSYICRKYEAIILEEVENTFEMDIKMYDGFMIQCDKINDIDETINKLNEITKDYSIKLINKVHDISIRDKVLELQSNNTIEIAETTLQDIAKELFNKTYKDRLVYNYNVLWFKSSSGWINNEKTIKRFIFNELTTFNLYLKIFILGDLTYKRVSASKDYTEILTFLSAWTTTNDKLVEEINLFCEKKIYFKNGYFDCILNKFIETKDFNTLKRIEKDYYDISNYKEEIKFIYDEILNPIFTCEKDTDVTRKQLLDNFLYRMARCMYGYYRDKNWYSIEGLRDGGKGMITELLAKTFENYIGTTSGENFLYKNTPNNDEAKSKSFFIDFIGTRLVISNEMKTDKNSRIDGNKIKSFCSGGDQHCARKNFQDEQYFTLCCGLVFFNNDMPDIEPADAKERLIEYSLCSKFCDEELYKKKQNSTEQTFRYYKKNDDLKSKISDQKIQMAFFHIITKALYSDSSEYPIELKKLNETDLIDDFDKFRSLFDFENNNEEEQLLLKDIVDECKRVKILFNQRKIKQLLINEGIEFKKTNKGQTALKLKFS